MLNQCLRNALLALLFQVQELDEIHQDQVNHYQTEGKQMV